MGSVIHHSGLGSLAEVPDGYKTFGTFKQLNYDINQNKFGS